MLQKLLPLALALALAAPAAEAAAPADIAATLRLTLLLGCDSRVRSPQAMAQHLPGAMALKREPIPERGPPVGTKWTFGLQSGGQLLLERFMRGGVVSSFIAEYDEPQARGRTRPLLAATAGPNCALDAVRRLVYDGAGHAEAIELLDGNLAPTGGRELLSAEVPPGRDARGVTVAQLDTGVNYLLPEIALHLARDASGAALGYDFWAMDARPFDRNPVVSPFFPERHGTKTASVLLREAPQVRLIPYRYPRPDMSRLAALVDDAAAKGARILAISLGSDFLDEWRSFAAAARRHPEMLIVVSAGNDGRDLDVKPVYPAALDLANKISVASFDSRSGRLADDANWGRRTVDLAVPGEDIPVTGFTGEAERVSGSSYAAPRVAALAARLLLAHPGWRAAELKAAIFARAVPLATGGRPLLRRGVIRDPTAP